MKSFSINLIFFYEPVLYQRSSVANNSFIKGLPISQYHLSKIHTKRTSVAARSIHFAIVYIHIYIFLVKERKKEETGEVENPMRRRRDRRSRGEGIQRLALNLTLDSTRSIRVLSRIISMAPGLTGPGPPASILSSEYMGFRVNTPWQEVRAIRGIVGAEPSLVTRGNEAQEEGMVFQKRREIDIRHANEFLNLCGRGENRGSRKRHFF